MDDEQSEQIVEEYHGEPPAVTISYGVFEVSVFGGPGDELEEVEETAERQVESAMGHIETLKRLDYDLDEEYSGNSPGPSRMSQ